MEKSVQSMMIVLNYSQVRLCYKNTKNQQQTNNEIYTETETKFGVINEDEECKIYRPLIHRNALGIHLNKGGRKNVSTPRKHTAIKFAQNESTFNHCHSYVGNEDYSTRRSISAQTDISALPEHWRSDSHLLKGIFMNGVFTLPPMLTNTYSTDPCVHFLK